jgi:lysophospholipase L1-like esterase
MTTRNTGNSYPSYSYPVINESLDIGTTTSRLNALYVTTLNATNFKQPYAPITLTSTANFFGDSIVAGANLSSPATQRWSALLCAALGKTENNQGVGSSSWLDSAILMYANHVSGRTTFLGWGINDIRFTTVYLDETLATAEAMILFACLPAANIQNVRSASVTKGGGWTNTIAYTSYGMFAGIGATLTATVTGRYVVFATTLIAAATMANHGSITFSVDGTTITSNCPQVYGTAGGFLSNNLGQQLFMYDTGSGATTSHTLIITVGTQTGTGAPTFVDWIGSFTPSMTGLSSVILTAVQKLPSLFFSGTGGISYEVYRQTLNTGYERLAKRLRTIYGLPVYFVAESGSYSMSELTNDIIHPNPAGQSYIYSRVLNVLTNGE